MAAGLGRLGRAITERQERREAGHRDKTLAMRELAGMRKKEFARLKEQGGYRTLEQRWSAKGFLEEYLKRRDERIAVLAKENPRAARMVAEKSATLTEDVSRRAMVIEAANTGDALVSDINAAVGDAVETVRADPTQRAAVLAEIRTTLTGLADAGMDADAIATIVGMADRKIAGVAFARRLEEDPEAAREEFAAGEFGDELSQELSKALLGKAGQAIKIGQQRVEADAKAAEDAYRARFNDYARRLATDDVAEDDAFSEEAIRASVSPEVADMNFFRGLERRSGFPMRSRNSGFCRMTK